MKKKWTEHYMRLAETASLSSKDPSTKVGAVIVNEITNEHASGFNGFAKGSNENMFPMDTSEKYIHMLHAEQNALDFFSGQKQDLYCFSTHSPCPACLNKLIQNNIKRGYYKSFIGSWNRTITEEYKDWEGLFIPTLTSILSVYRVLLANKDVVFYNIVSGESYLSEIISLFNEMQTSFKKIKDKDIISHAIGFISSTLESSRKTYDSLHGKDQALMEFISFIGDFKREMTDGNKK